MMENQLSQDQSQIADYLTRVNIDKFLSGVFPDNMEISAKVIEHFNLPPAGSHLKSPRIGYTHHGLYIGNGKVIHYAGWSKPLQSGDIEKVTLEEFCSNRGYEVVHHPNIKDDVDTIIARAYERLGESEYSLILQNCEHFVHDCIYGFSKSNQVKAVMGVAGKVVRRGTPATAAASAIFGLRNSISGYLKGDISRGKLLEDIGHSATTTTSTMYYASLGQAAIPVPVVGALIGASIGYFVGDALIRSGHIALGETPAVKAARERREKIEALCDQLIPEMEKSRHQLIDYINTHFKDRKAAFEQAFTTLDDSFQQWDPDELATALNQINAQFGDGLQLPSFQEFDEMMESDKAFTF